METYLCGLNGIWMNHIEKMMSVVYECIMWFISMKVLGK